MFNKRKIKPQEIIRNHEGNCERRLFERRTDQIKITTRSSIIGSKQSEKAKSRTRARALNCEKQNGISIQQFVQKFVISFSMNIIIYKLLAIAISSVFVKKFAVLNLKLLLYVDFPE